MPAPDVAPWHPRPVSDGDAGLDDRSGPDSAAPDGRAEASRSYASQSSGSVPHVRAERSSMKIRAGYAISYDCPQPTPMILQLSVHPSRTSDLVTRDHMRFDPPIPAKTYHDGFGNFCHVIRAPAGRLTMSANFLVRDDGVPDVIALQAEQHALEDLPVEVLIFLLGSRYCETDRLSNIAWSLFGNVPKGWPLVRAICDYVHDRITFGYQYASPTKTAWDANYEQRGVCRDFAHLAITLCRCMNIPARYCTGYLGDIGVRPDGLRRMVRGVRRRPLAHVRSEEQHAAHWPHPHRARPRCDRRRHQHRVRPKHARRVHRLGGRRHRSVRELTAGSPHAVSPGMRLRQRRSGGRSSKYG